MVADIDNMSKMTSPPHDGTKMQYITAKLLIASTGPTFEEYKALRQAAGQTNLGF